jgi:hypothetical protein
MNEHKNQTILQRTNEACVCARVEYTFSPLFHLASCSNSFVLDICKRKEGLASMELLLYSTA